MPSTRVPTTITTGGGPPPVVASENVAAALNAHITNPTGAHAATAISYAGGPNWHNGTTNPASDVETQLDKTISDLADDGTSGVIGSDLIGTDASPTWHNTTWMTKSSVKDRVDLIVSLLATDTGTAGADLIGAAQIANTTVTIPLGSIEDQLRAISLAANVQYAGGPSWAGGTGTITNPATNLEAQVDKIITDLAKIGGSDAGVFRIGTDGVVTGTVSLPAGHLEQRLVDLQNGNIRAGTRNDWRGGRSNPDIDVPAAIDKIITDLGAQNNGDDGAERIGAQAYSGAGVLLSLGSVRSQLNELSADAVSLSRDQTVGGVKTYTGGARFGDFAEFFGSTIVNGSPTGSPDPTAPALETTELPSGTGNKKLLWKFPLHTSGGDPVYMRFYADGASSAAYSGAIEITSNARWVPASNYWTVDDGSGSTEPSSILRFGGYGNMIIGHHNRILGTTWPDSYNASGWHKRIEFNIPNYETANSSEYETNIDTQGKLISDRVAQAQGGVSAGNGGGGLRIGAYAPYSHHFPSTPSSITSFVSLNSFNVGSSDAEVSSTRTTRGVSWDIDTVSTYSRFHFTLVVT